MTFRSNHVLLLSNFPTEIIRALTTPSINIPHRQAHPAKKLLTFDTLCVLATTHAFKYIPTLRTSSILGSFEWFLWLVTCVLFKNELSSERGIGYGSIFGATVFTATKFGTSLSPLLEANETKVSMLTVITLNTVMINSYLWDLLLAFGTLFTI